MGRKSAERKQELQQSIINEANDFVERIRQSKSLTPIYSSLVLGPKESAFLEEKTILKEPRSVRRYRSSGIRFRVMKGVSVGTSGGHAESHKEWRALDLGTLIITNKKIVFDGSKEDRSIPLNKILTVSPMLDSIEISSSSRVGSMIFPVKNPFIWAATIRILSAVEDPLNIGDLNLDIKFK